jgi:hypothetical protein
MNPKKIKMINLIKKEREKKDMNDLNKLSHTKVGDMIDSYVTVVKTDGTTNDIHINDTFFVKDIIKENKTWNGMNMEEKTDVLVEAHAFSPRFLSKTWEDLPKELQDVLTKTNIEESTHGQLGGNRAGISTDTDVKTPEDYKGESSEDKKEEFKHEKKKPTVDKNNGMEEDHKKKDQFDGMKEDWRHTGGDSDKHKIKSTWKSWLEKNVPKKGGKFQSQDYVGQAIHAKNRNLETEKPLKEYDNYDNKHGLVARTERSRGNSLTSRNRHQGSVRPSGMNRYDEDGDIKTPKVGKAPIKKAWESWLEKDALDPKAKPQSDLLGDPNTATVRNTRVGQKPLGVISTPSMDIDFGSPDNMIGGENKIRDSPEQFKRNEAELREHRGEAKERRRRMGEDEKRHRGDVQQNIRDRFQNKSYGKPLYGVTTLDKEGDGAGNSGVISTETAGVYNPRNVNSDGRYRDQERDREDERNTRN